MSSPEMLARSVNARLDELGVTTAAVVFRDPDSDDVMTIRRGDSCWLSGALRMIEQEVTDNWVRVKRQRTDDQP